MLLVGIASLYGSRPDVIKEIYAALLRISAEFARNDYNKDAVIQYLSDECKYDKNRAETYAEVYQTNKLKLQVILSKIGSHLPHIVDANWKIDYVVKVCPKFITTTPNIKIFTLV